MYIFFLGYEIPALVIVVLRQTPLCVVNVHVLGLVTSKDYVHYCWTTALPLEEQPFPNEWTSTGWFTHSSLVVSFLISSLCLQYRHRNGDPQADFSIHHWSWASWSCLWAHNMDRVMDFPPDLIYMFSFGLGLPDQLFGLVIKTQ